MKPAPPAILVALALTLTACGSEDSPRATAEPAPTRSTTSTSTDECVSKGITAGGTGECTGPDGVTSIVRNRGQTLSLDAYSLRIQKIYVTRSVSPPSSFGGNVERAQGTFVIFQVRVRNRSKQPFDFNRGLSYTGLVVGNDSYSPTANTAAGVYKAFSVLGERAKTDIRIQPGASNTEFIVFDIPRAAAKAAQEPGSALNVIPKSEVDSGNDASVGVTSAVGTIRLSQG